MLNLCVIFFITIFSEWKIADLLLKNYIYLPSEIKIIHYSNHKQNHKQNFKQNHKRNMRLNMKLNGYIRKYRKKN